MKTLRYVPEVLLAVPPKLPANLSAKGPAMTGPISAIRGATIDIIFDSSTVRPLATMWRGKNGKRHPTPAEKKIH